MDATDFTVGAYRKAWLRRIQSAQVLRQMLADVSGQNYGKLGRMPVRQYNVEAAPMLAALTGTRRRVECNVQSGETDVYLCTCCEDADCNECGLEPECVDQCACEGVKLATVRDAVQGDIESAVVKGLAARAGQLDVASLVERVLVGQPANPEGPCEFADWQLSCYMTVQNVVLEGFGADNPL